MSKTSVHQEWTSPDGAIRLVCADALEFLPTLAAGSVDAIVTDPPFGISWGRATWDDAERDYPALIGSLVSEAQRLVECGRVFVFQAMPNVARFHEWFPEGWRLFAACKNFAQIRPTGVWHSWDPVVFWENGKPEPSPDGVNRDYYVGNSAGVFGENIDHPCPKPIDTMVRLVEIAALRDQVVADPFMGSGTTMAACVRAGRRGIGVEKHPPYFDIACRRVEKALDDQALYVPPPRERQGELMEAAP